MFWSCSTMFTQEVQSQREVLLKDYDDFTRLAKVRSSRNFENTSIMPGHIGMKYGSGQRYNGPNGFFNTQASALAIMNLRIYALAVSSMRKYLWWIMRCQIRDLRFLLDSMVIFNTVDFDMDMEVLKVMRSYQPQCLLPPQLLSSIRLNLHLSLTHHHVHITFQHLTSQSHLRCMMTQACWQLSAVMEYLFGTSASIKESGLLMLLISYVQ